MSSGQLSKKSSFEFVQTIKLITFQSNRKEQDGWWWRGLVLAAELCDGRMKWKWRTWTSLSWKRRLRYFHCVNIATIMNFFSFISFFIFHFHLIVNYNLDIRTYHLICSSKYIYTLNCLASRNMSSDIWFEMSTLYVRTRHVNGYHTHRWGLIRVVFKFFFFSLRISKKKKIFQYSWVHDNNRSLDRYCAGRNYVIMSQFDCQMIWQCDVQYQSS